MLNALNEQEFTAANQDEAEDFIADHHCKNPQSTLADFMGYGVAKWWGGGKRYVLRRTIRF